MNLYQEVALSFNKVGDPCSTVLAIVATAVSLIAYLIGAARNMSSKRSSSPLWERHDIVASFNTENGTKVAKLAGDFDIPTTTLTTILKNKDKIICTYEAGRSNERVSGNPY